MVPPPLRPLGLKRVGEQPCDAATARARRHKAAHPTRRDTPLRTRLLPRREPDGTPDTRTLRIHITSALSGVLGDITNRRMRPLDIGHTVLPPPLLIRL